MPPSPRPPPWTLWRRTEGWLAAASASPANIRGRDLLATMPHLFRQQHARIAVCFLLRRRQCAPVWPTTRGAGKPGERGKAPLGIGVPQPMKLNQAHLGHLIDVDVQLLSIGFVRGNEGRLLPAHKRLGLVQRLALVLGQYRNAARPPPFRPAPL